MPTRGPERVLRVIWGTANVLMALLMFSWIALALFFFVAAQ
jgi:hypothetical protein